MHLVARVVDEVVHSRQGRVKDLRDVLVRLDGLLDVPNQVHLRGSKLALGAVGSVVGNAPAHGFLYVSVLPIHLESVLHLLEEVAVRDVLADDLVGLAALEEIRQRLPACLQDLRVPVVDPDDRSEVQMHAESYGMGLEDGGMRREAADCPAGCELERRELTIVAAHGFYGLEDRHKARHLRVIQLNNCSLAVNNHVPASGPLENALKRETVIPFAIIITILLLLLLIIIISSSSIGEYAASFQYISRVTSCGRLRKTKTV